MREPTLTDEDAGRAQVARWVADAAAVTVLTGAGISTESGIPDYRGPNGVWTRNPDAMRTVTLQDYVGDADVRRRAWRARREHAAWTAQPNAAHRALVDLERSGRLVALLTQTSTGCTSGRAPRRTSSWNFTARCMRCSAWTARPVRRCPRSCSG